MLHACNQIAILLTRGVEDARNMVSAGRKVVAVSGRLASDVSLAFSVDSGEEAVPLDGGEEGVLYSGKGAGSAGEPSDALFTQNPTPKDSLKFRIDHITPSLTPLEDIGALPYVSSLTVCILLTGIPMFPGST